MILFALSCGSVGPEGWPSRSIELVVFSSAGGGTDLANRALAAALSEELGVPIRVLNMTAGRGGAAAQYVFSGPPDGHRWLGSSETILSLAVRGAHETTSRDWHFFIFAGSPGVLSVAGDSPHESFEKLLETVQEHPRRLKIASSGPGSVWHLQTELLRRQASFNVRYIPYHGSGPSQLAALSGEVDLVLTSLAEQARYLRGGRLRPLAVVEREAWVFDEELFIPPITDWFPELNRHLPLPHWLGFMLPRGTPPETLERIREAFHRALDSESVLHFLDGSGLEPFGLSGEEAQSMAEILEKVFTWMLFELGLVDTSPERFGISRP